MILYNNIKEELLYKYNHFNIPRSSMQATNTIIKYDWLDPPNW